MVFELEKLIHDTVNKVIDFTRDGINEKKPIDLFHAFRCVSVDVISEYAFDKSYELLDSPDLGHHFFKMMRGLGPAFYFFQQFPLLRHIVLKLPPVVTYHMGGSMKQVTNLQMEGIRQLNDVKSRMDAGTLDKSRPTIFSELLDPEKQYGLPYPSIFELKDDVFSILAAAADTTGNAMTVSCYKVLSDKNIYATLREELLSAFPDPNSELSFAKLEKLPYLVSLIPLCSVFRGLC